MTDYAVEKLESCRVCDVTSLTKILHLNNMPFTDTFKTTAEEIDFLHDIDVFVCDSCGVVQTQHNVSVADYYEYEYNCSNEL